MNATPLYAIPNITSFVGMFEYANTVTNQMFTFAGLMIFFVVCVVSMSHAGMDKAFPAGSFLTFIVASLFFTVGLVSEYMMIMPAILVGLSVLMLLKER